MKHKFRATPSEYKGRKYSSKLEKAYAMKLDMAKISGDLVFFLEQVPFRLPGGIIFKPDFMEFWNNGDIIVTEVKGFETKDYIMRRKLFEATYPITLNVVKKVK